MHEKNSWVVDGSIDISMFIRIILRISWIKITLTYLQEYDE